jgi:hypothetical protein
MPLGDSPADHLDRPACPVRGRPQVGDERLQRSVPQVVRLPPGDLVEQARIGTGALHRRRPQGELALVMLRLGARRRLRGEAFADTLEPDWILTAGTGQFDRVASSSSSTSPGKVWLRGCSGTSRAAMSASVSPREMPLNAIRIVVRRSSPVGRDLADMARRYARQAARSGASRSCQRRRRAGLAPRRRHRMPPTADAASPNSVNPRPPGAHRAGRRRGSVVGADRAAWGWVMCIRTQAEGTSIPRG